MTKTVEKLLRKMNEDKEFAEKILTQSEKEKVIEIAKGEGIELTLEGIDEANEIIRIVLEKKNDGELSEEELESVAGGTIGGIELILFTAMSAAASAGVSGAASATAASAASASAVAVSGATVISALTAMTVAADN